MIPDFLTHYYRRQPFQTLTELESESRNRVLAKLNETRKLPRRLKSAFYFAQRLRYEEVMRRQLVEKGGEPQRERPHYLVLGKSEIWEKIEPNHLTIPLSAIPSAVLSFTYTDSWGAYMDVDLQENRIPRKPQYEMVYRVEELDELFKRYGWPGDRWKTEQDWQHDVYVEAQIWSDEPLQPYREALGDELALQ